MTTPVSTSLQFADVTTRWCVRAARAAALRLFATASFVTQQVLITATSASARSLWPSRRSASRTSCTSACETLQPRKSTRNVAMRWILEAALRPYAT